MKMNLAGCVIIQDGAILLLHRIKTDWYELPGGKIDGDENAEITAVRELKEELSCDVKILEKLGEKDFKDGEYIMGYTWFRAEIVEGQTPSVGEPEKFDHFLFIPLQELSKQKLSTNMQGFLNELEAGNVRL